MANGAVAVAVAVANRKAREQAMRKYALEPIRLALKREGRTITWLMGKLEDQASIRVKRSTLYAYLGGGTRVRRQFVQSACLIAGANYGDVCARVAGNEAVLFQAGK